MFLLRTGGDRLTGWGLAGSRGIAELVGTVRLGWMRRGRRVGLRDCGPVCLTVSVMKDDGIAGDEPLADGMHIAVRVRRDFTVTDAGRLLAAARAAYVQVNSGTTADEAGQW